MSIVVSRCQFKLLECHSLIWGMGEYSEKYIFCHFILRESLSLFSASQNQEKYNREIFQNMWLIVCSHSQLFFFYLKI